MFFSNNYRVASKGFIEFFLNYYKDPPLIQGLFEIFFHKLKIVFNIIGLSELNINNTINVAIRFNNRFEINEALDLIRNRDVECRRGNNELILPITSIDLLFPNWKEDLNSYWKRIIAVANFKRWVSMNYGIEIVVSSNLGTKNLFLVIDPIFVGPICDNLIEMGFRTSIILDSHYNMMIVL